MIRTAKDGATIGDAIAGIALIIGFVLLIYSIKDIHMIFYAPDIFWWGIALIIGVAVYFLIRSKGVFGFFN